MSEKYLFLTEKDVNKVINNDYSIVIEAIEDSLIAYQNKRADQPDKISQIFDKESQNRINCMTATILDENISGMKWVSVFPTNASKGVATVEGFTLVSELDTGTIKCIINSSECTSLRTAAVGAVAAKHLARKDSESVGFIGAGEEAKAHFKLIKYCYPMIKKCYFSSRTNSRIVNLINELSSVYTDVEFINCNSNYSDAIINSDIIVTAISSQEQVLKADWIKPGALYIHVAGLEDEFAVAEKSTKIVCDSWECVKHRTQTIAQMYTKGILSDDDIYADLGEILLGDKKGREESDDLIYFNSVGLAVEDVILADRIYDKAIELGIGTWIVK